MGIAGLTMARRARRADYRTDMTSTIGMMLSGVGIFLCLLAPALSLVSNIVLSLMG